MFCLFPHVINVDITKKGRQATSNSFDENCSWKIYGDHVNVSSKSKKICIQMDILCCYNSQTRVTVNT